MARVAFYDPISGVLKAHGFIMSNESGDRQVVVPDDFGLEPGKWRWDGAQHVAYAAPPLQSGVDRAALLALLDDMASDALLPAKVRALAAHLRKAF